MRRLVCQTVIVVATIISATVLVIEGHGWMAFLIMLFVFASID